MTFHTGIPTQEVIRRKNFDSFELRRSRKWKINFSKPFTLFVTMATLTLPLQVEAQDSVFPIPETVTLDGRTYKKEQILNSFLNSAFTTETLFRNFLTVNPGSLTYPPRLKVEYPWLYPFIYPDEGKTPSLLAVSKWTKPVEVAFGMPSELKKAAEYNGSTSSRELKLDAESQGIPLEQERIEKLKTFLTDLSTTPNIEISMSGRENDADTGNLRIVFVDSPDAENPKFWRAAFGIGQPHYYRSTVEGLIKTGFVFTPDLEDQVSGYFLTNGNNQIEMSFCYIYDGHQAPLQDALIRECIVRSLGLPGNSTIGADKSLIGIWNRKSHQENDFKNFAKSLSEFDRYFFTLLYSPRISPGDTYAQIERNFASTE